MDYVGLQTAIADFLNRADLYASIPTFIQLTEAQLIRRLTQAGVQGAVTRATASISTEFEATPTDYDRQLSMTIYDPVRARWMPLEPVTPTGMATLKGDREATSAIPDRFSVVDGSFWFSPTPDQAYTVDMVYVAMIAPLTVTNTTNWVLTNYPDAYLYGALTHAAPYVGAIASANNPSPLSTWRNYYESAIAEIVQNERDKRGTMFTPTFRASDAPPNYGRRRWLYNINTG